MSRRVAMLVLALSPRLAAQATGTVSGRVRDAVTGRPIVYARVTIDGGARAAATDTGGAYRFQEIRSGLHSVRVAIIGYEAAARDSVLVESGQTTIQDFALRPQAVPVGGVAVPAAADPVLDPRTTADIQRVSADELRRMPVTTVDEAVALSAGAVGESYRGGRIGEQAFVLDGLGVKNQLDASTGEFGVRVPPDLLTEATLVTNGFSARYGEAISGLVNVVTKDAGDRWQGRAAYETGRVLPGSLDPELDRVVLSGDGPLTGRIGLAAAIDGEARLDADPVNAPPPTDPLDPRLADPSRLPHNSGERLDAAVKLTVPLDSVHTLRLFALHSEEQRLLYDPAYKYDETLAPGQRVGGTLVTAHLQRATGAFVGDVRLGFYDRQFIRGPLTDTASYDLGAAILEPFHFRGEGIAERQDMARARGSLPGFTPPDFSVSTPWGVPGFFLGQGPRGDLQWNHFRELRARFDGSVGGSMGSVAFGGEVARQRVQTFERTLAYLPVDSGVPPPVAANFTPWTGAMYVEPQVEGRDFAFTFGLRWDRFAPGGDTSIARPARSAVSPRFAFSTTLAGATFVVSWGRFNEAPDYQYLVDAAFDDTARTGRFRRGNPDLGFESATQWEFSVRARPAPGLSLRANTYLKQLSGLVASVPVGVDPDSTLFQNFDYGSVRGVELLVERDMRDGWGVRASYTLQSATATATNPFELFSRIRSPGDVPARVEVPLDYDRRHALTVVAQGARYGFEGAAVIRVESGLPYSRTNATGDTLIGLPNSRRLPSQGDVALLLRRPVRVGGRRGSIYLDARNLLDLRNVVAVWRSTGSTTLTPAALEAMADSAYAAHPEPIPYESPRYRAWADLDRDGYVDGPAELLPLYRRAAQDFAQPLFFFGPPRVLRVGFELEF